MRVLSTPGSSALCPAVCTNDGSQISFSPDGTRYLTVDFDRSPRIWDLSTGAVLADSEGSGLAFSYFHEGTEVFTPDGREVVALQYVDP